MSTSIRRVCLYILDLAPGPGVSLRSAQFQQSSPTGEYTSRVWSRQTRNFGFGQSSQSHLRLRLRHRRQIAAGALHASVVSGGPGTGLSSLPHSLLRSKDRCAPSVVRPLAGAGIHWIPAFYPARPCPWPGRTRSLSCPFRPALRLPRCLARRKAPKKFLRQKHRSNLPSPRNGEGGVGRACSSLSCLTRLE